MKKVLVIGAGPLQLPVIKKVKELGHIAICVDGNPNAVGFKYADEYRAIDIVDTEKCLQYAKENNIDGVLTAATDFGVITAAEIANKLGLVGLNPSVARTIKNKFQVREQITNCGLDDTVCFFMISDVKNLSKIKNKIKYPSIVKPVDGSGSTAVTKVYSFNELNAACIKAIEGSITRKAIIEPYITGEEYGVESFVDNGEVHILAIMKKFMTDPPNYAELGHVCPSGLTEKIEEKIKKVVSNAIKSLGINFGSVNIDLILTRENNVKIIDIGARMGGNLIGSHIVPLSTGVDLIENSVKAVLGEKVDFTIKKHSVIATRILNFKSGFIYKIGNTDALIDNEEVLDVIITVKEGVLNREYKTNRDSCGYVVVNGKSVSDAIMKAMYTRNEIEKLFIIGQQENVEYVAASNI